MIEKQFGTEYGPALQRGDKTACIVSLQAEIDRLGGVNGPLALSCSRESGSTPDSAPVCSFPPDYFSC